MAWNVPNKFNKSKQDGLEWIRMCLIKSIRVGWIGMDCNVFSKFNKNRMGWNGLEWSTQFNKSRMNWNVFTKLNKNRMGWNGLECFY